MGLEVVDGVERFVVEDGESAGGEGADEEAAEEAGGVGDGEGVDFGPVVLAGGGFEAGASEGLVDDGEDGFEVRAGGDFWDDAAVGFEDVDLGDDDVCEQLVVVHDGGGGFVAGGFDGEDVHWGNYNIKWG